MLRVEQCMSPHVVVASPTTTLDRVAQLMMERGVGSTVIMDGDKLEGIITERDIMRAVARGLVPWGTKASDCMTARPTTVDRFTTVGNALSTMLSRGFRHLPVMNDGTVVGVVSLRDLASLPEEEKDAASPP